MQILRGMRAWGAALALSSTGISACSDLGPTSPAYRGGELGNGGFAFKCDEAVSCRQWSDDAAKFPDTVALGSTFRLRYIPRSASTPTLNINITTPENPDGTIIEGVGSDFLTKSVDGFLAVGEGYGTVVARNAQGVVLDYTQLRILRPDSLFVYQADSSSERPPRITSVQLRVGENVTYRAAAERSSEILAGEIRCEWTSGDESVVDTTVDSSGKVTVYARSAGETTLSVAGGSFSQELAVEVTP
jgi:hypothetical protein